MPRSISKFWVPADGPGMHRRDKLGGTFDAHVPDLLLESPPEIPPVLARRSAEVERKILDLRSLAPSGQLEGISRFLLRSEAVSSSKIEGIAPRVDKVVLAELAQDEEIRGFKENAEAVARNIAVLRRLGECFEKDADITPETLEGFQSQLLGDRSSIPKGMRTMQNWIGGSNHSPIGAEFVPPPPEFVPSLMQDLCDYVNGALHGALIQAAIAHVQFETIHPFADGNGRVGRALIHGILVRRGLTAGSVLPISLVLNTWSRRYVDGLTAFRHGNCAMWIETFLDATDQAVAQARSLAVEIEEIQQDWAKTFEAYRRTTGKTRALRVDSIEFQLLKGLASHPIVTVKSLCRMYGAQSVNARRALESFHDAGIVRKKVVGTRGDYGYYADDIIDLITQSDRNLASSRFDTRVSPPAGRAVPSPVSQPRL